MAEPQKYPTLYTRDSDGRVRTWWVERLEDKICNVAGLEDGNLVRSKWKVIKGKNLGKRNETTPVQQAELDIAALYAKQLKKHGYWENREDVDNEARYIAPMLAEKMQDYPIVDHTEVWYSQPKLDGFRCISTHEQSTSKHGEVFACTGHILEKLREINRPEIKAFDGELYNHDLRDNFDKIQSMLSKKKLTVQELNAVYDLVQFHIYDFVPAPGYENLTYEERQAILAYELPKNDLTLIHVRSDKIVASSLEEFNQKVEELRAGEIAKGYEGQMLRKGTSLYEVNTRVRTLLKNKVFIDREFKIKKILEGEGNGAGLAKKVLLEDERGVEFKAGINGDNKFTKQLWADKEKYEGNDSEATVRYFSLTPGKKVPRFGKAVRFFEGKRKI